MTELLIMLIIGIACGALLVARRPVQMPPPVVVFVPRPEPPPEASMGCLPFIVIGVVLLLAAIGNSLLS